MSDHPSVLGELQPAEFLRTYWQREPLLIRDACPNYRTPITADELAGLATEEEVESRIVIEGIGSARETAHTPPHTPPHNRPEDAWQLRQGPFDDETFAALPSTHWSLLVQAIDLWVPEARALLERFDFIPPWRLDDLMASFAPRGGSVGPHFDQYDVFLLQVEGERRWQIGQRCDKHTRLLKNTDLQIIADFEAKEDWLLAPGDMLYLPPGIAHWGVAETDCMTFSIGFRSPLVSDMLGDLALDIAASGVEGADAHYRDPPLSPNMATEVIDEAFVQQAKQQLQALVDNDELLADWFARFMTAPKYPDLVADTGEQRRAQIGTARYRNGERDQ